MNKLLSLDEFQQRHSFMNYSISTMLFYKQDCIVNVKLKFVLSKHYKSVEIDTDFINLKKFDFVYGSEMDFYLVDRVKMFRVSEDEIYISLDPYDESPEPHIQDKGIIICSRFSFCLSTLTA